jgi:hypothetical protein
MQSLEKVDLPQISGHMAEAGEEQHHQPEIPFPCVVCLHTSSFVSELHPDCVLESPGGLLAQ